MEEEQTLIEPLRTKTSCHHCRRQVARFKVSYCYYFVNNKRYDWKECYGRRYSRQVAELCFTCLKIVIAKDCNRKVLTETKDTPKVEFWDRPHRYWETNISDGAVKTVFPDKKKEATL